MLIKILLSFYLLSRQEPILLLYYEETGTTPGHYQSIEASPGSLLLKHYNFKKKQELSRIGNTTVDSVSQPIPGCVPTEQSSLSFSTTIQHPGKNILSS